MYSPAAWSHVAGVGVEPVEVQPLVLAGVLHAGLAQVVQDHGGEVLLLAAPPARVTVPSDVVVGGGEHAVGREALDRERAAHADALVVLVGLVVERLGVGVAGDGGVDLLAGHAFLDVRVVGDGLEGDVRHALVDEALADVAVGLVGGRHLAGQLGFLLDALGRVGQQVVGVLGGHQAGAGQGQGDAAGVAW